MRVESVQYILSDCDHPKHGGAGYTLDIELHCGDQFADMKIVTLLPHLGLLLTEHEFEGKPVHTHFDVGAISLIRVNWA